MALDVTPIYRNLRTRVTFFGLEAEDLFAILAVAVVMNICGRFLNREMFGLPMNMVLQYLVPILSVPALMLFKYGNQRGSLLDWVLFHTKPHVYSALERDRELTREYIKDEELAMPLTTEKHEKSLAQPPLCEQLKVRDLADDLLIQLNGSFVAGYRVSGIHSYYASDDDRNRTKLVLEA